jgi:hypothetical protein
MRIWQDHGVGRVAIERPTFRETWAATSVTDQPKPPVRHLRRLTERRLHPDRRHDATFDCSLDPTAERSVSDLSSDVLIELMFVMVTSQHEPLFVVKSFLERMFAFRTPAG